MLIGQLVVAPGGRGRAEAGRLYGLPILRAETNPEGFWGPRRLNRAGRSLRLGGALRVLAPESLLPLLGRFGLRPVELDGFLRAQSVPLALEALERQGLAPDRATVALRGTRAGGEMARTAAQLCSRVRNLVVDAPSGGKELALWLRREFGIPILPPGERGEVALRFQTGPLLEGETALELFGSRPRLAGLSIAAPGLEEGDRENLSLLAALWEGGRLGREDIKIT